MKLENALTLSTILICLLLGQQHIIIRFFKEMLQQWAVDYWGDLLYMTNTLAFFNIRYSRFFQHMATFCFFLTFGFYLSVITFCSFLTFRLVFTDLIYFLNIFKRYYYGFCLFIPKCCLFTDLGRPMVLPLLLLKPFSGDIFDQIC